MALTKIDDRGLKTPIDLIDNEKIRLGTGNDLELRHDGTSSFIDQVTDCPLYIRSTQANTISLQPNTGEDGVKIINDGAVELYYNGVKKFETISSGVSVTGALAIPDGASDGNRIAIGNHDDLLLYHDGSNSYIKDAGTGDLNIAGSIVRLQSSGGETLARGVENGAFELYHNNIKTFQTSTNGIQVFGPEGGNATQYFYADEGDDNADEWGLIAHSSLSKFSIDNYAGGGWETSLTCEGNGAAKLFYDDSMKLETSANGIKVYNRIGVNITPTTALQFLDHSGSYEGRASWGNSADLQIYHNGTDSRIINAGSDLYFIRLVITT